MKTSLFLWTSVALFVSTATAFQISRAPLVRSDPALSMATTDKKKTKKSRSSGNPIGNFLQQITNNFEPFHGHGSLENDLEEQWQAQQALVAKRRSQHLDKDHLKAKYKNPSKVKFDGRVGDSSTSEFGKNLSP
jgi:hypothetical protein